MVRSFLIFALFSFNGYAQIFGIGGEKKVGRLPELIEKLRSLEIKADPFFEETFNKAVKDIENGVEEEKLFCGGESTDTEGKQVTPEKKQLCMRELKKNYLEAMQVVFTSKKKYLEMVHNRHMGRLNEVHTRLKADIEKSF
jgi:hypothetical protein